MEALSLQEGTGPCWKDFPTAAMRHPGSFRCGWSWTRDPWRVRACRWTPTGHLRVRDREGREHRFAAADVFHLRLGTPRRGIGHALDQVGHQRLGRAKIGPAELGPSHQRTCPACRTRDCWPPGATGRTRRCGVWTKNGWGSSRWTSSPPSWTRNLSGPSRRPTPERRVRHGRTSGGPERGGLPHGLRTPLGAPDPAAGWSEEGDGSGGLPGGGHSVQDQEPKYGLIVQGGPGGTVAGHRRREGTCCCSPNLWGRGFSPPPPRRGWLPRPIWRRRRPPWNGSPSRAWLVTRVR